MPTNTSSDTNSVPKNILDAGAEAVRMYERLLSEGYGHRWAEMCALQQPPGLRGTDRALMQGRYNQEWLNELPADHALALTKEAREAGINISGKFYCSQLADKRAHRDPAAWVDTASQIKTVARQRNLTVHGIVEHEAEPQTRPQSKVLSDRLIREMSKKEKAAHPSKSAGEIREMVIDKYAPHFKKNKK